jgi:alpha-ketoglutarate-dependent taurine dioxygenase
MSNKAVAQLLPLHACLSADMEHTVKDLDTQDMRVQMLGTPVLHSLEREQLKWQRLRPFERFAALIEQHWERHRGVLRTPQQGQAQASSKA